MHFFLNIGNTRAAIAQGTPGGNDFAVDYLPTQDIANGWIPPDDIPWQATAACVVPATRKRLMERFPRKMHFITPEDYPDIDCSAYDVPRLGADRLANIAAAHRLSPDRSVLVLDCGTALNSVCVSADGRFLGGVILPGRETALKSLARNTAQLPEFAVTAPHDFNPFGLTSEEGIRNGVDIGILGAAEKIIRATKAMPEMTDCRIWFAGGDAPFFVEHLDKALEVELAPVPLTLYGVALAAKQ